MAIPLKSAAPLGHKAVCPEDLQGTASEHEIQYEGTSIRHQDHIEAFERQSGERKPLQGNRQDNDVGKPLFSDEDVNISPFPSEYFTHKLTSAGRFSPKFPLFLSKPQKTFLYKKHGPRKSFQGKQMITDLLKTACWL